MKLAIFDIDGTLTHTNEADEEAFRKTCEEFLGLKNVSTDWSFYTHSTDSGILDQLLREHKNENLNSTHANDFKKIFTRVLAEIYSKTPTKFHSVPGANKVFQALKDRGWQISIATGAFRESAHFKLSKAEVAFEKISFACADDAFDRKDIISQSIERFRKLSGHTSEFTKVVYVGDGVWDLRSASKLGISFLGVDVRGKPEALLNLADVELISDYLSIDSLVEKLERAAVPELKKK